MMISWRKFKQDCVELAELLAPQYKEMSIPVYGIPTGGCFVAQQLAAINPRFVLMHDARPGCLVVDDLVDSGATMAKYPNHPRAALYYKPQSDVEWANATVQMVDGWIQFPWEAKATGPEDAVVRLLQWIGEDPLRDGLVNTPSRVTKALREMTEGYRQDPVAILGTVFEVAYDELVISAGIPFCSLCEHHMLPFIGTVDIGYIPGKVVGLSKLSRLVDCFSRRLQVQERMTDQIARAIVDTLSPDVAVIVKASHMCMECRGVRKIGSCMITSAMHGAFRDKPEARAEFLQLCRLES